MNSNIIIAGRVIFIFPRLIPLFFVIYFGISCKKFVTVDAPNTSITDKSVYSNDATAIAVLTGVYTNMSTSDRGLTAMSVYPSMSADEIAVYGTTNPTYVAYYQNKLTNQNDDFWSNIYQVVYILNSAIQGLDNNKNLTPAVQQQLMGEALFMRAFCYFYLINLYGDVPLVTSTDYSVNQILSRTPKSTVWQQVISDLKVAESLLSANYLNITLLNTTIERVRPTRAAATALLARSYLYMKDWANAEAQATQIINDSTLYSLDSLNGVFKSDGPEAIWQLQPVNAGQNTQDATLFVLPETGVSDAFPLYLDSLLVNSFEANDLRKVDWVGNVTIDNIIYYYPFKYKVSLYGAPVSEYTMVLRLGEQFLIRAEARTQAGKLTDAISDLNRIRFRAGLPSTDAATKDDVLSAIMHERQVELFTEWGHRWLDLKRTGTVDAVMQNVCPKKGTTWNTNWQWYPIPLTEIKYDVNLKQNNGY